MTPAGPKSPVLTGEPDQREAAEVAASRSSAARFKRSVKTWLRDWGALLGVGAAIVVFLGRCGLDQLESRFDALGTRIDDKAGEISNQVRIQTDAVEAVLTERLNGQTEVLRQKIDGETKLLAKEIEDVEQHLNQIEERLDGRSRDSVGQDTHRPDDGSSYLAEVGD